ncbi:hypothetical protein G6O69_02480 [Pseudenhygromyxa sp. WMMC2535]|uniref:hypothetical protein n=1 Tax=Pseudenhygromyxa sp. WMMC2535 TaxID=2712867 RepID=UPI0015539CDD|nr:hypothetical protein [Pseudenhygromyxa sp. WMMC2535]NVB36681.1 hypothetical protein [Pseudenhygromyxa sp. WMMC2535]
MRAWRARWQLRREREDQAAGKVVRATVVRATVVRATVVRAAGGRRRRRILATPALVLAFGAGLVLAQDPIVGAPVGLGQPRDFARTAAEDEVWVLYQDDKLLTARRKVEALLEDEPDSIVGHYVFGQILRRAEASLPRAMKELGRARELYERRYQPTVVNVSETPWLLHREILYAAQATAGELERHEYQLQLLDYHDSLYDPRLTAEHAWPLMLLGRFDEARKYAEKATDSPDAFQRSLGRNALCAIEGEAGARGARFDACLAAYEQAAEAARGDDPLARPDELNSVTVHAYNAALAALGVLRPDEAERLAQAGATRVEFTPANPWRLLVRLYIAQGRGNEAVEALREMQAWRRKQPPNLREQVRAESDVAFASLLLIAGDTETGMRVVDRAIINPDRRGLTTASREQTLGAHALLRRAMRRTHAERERERAVWSGSVEAVEIRAAGAQRQVDSWADAERIRSVGHDSEVLYRSFRPYLSGGLEPVPSWLLGDLIDVLGAGVTAVILEEVRVREGEDGSEELSEQFEPYFQGVEAELALRDGDEARALALAEEALDGLPQFEALLRARVEAVAGEAALAQGDLEAALGFFAAAMQRDAGIARRRGLALPAELSGEASGPVAERVRELLESSPRFDFGGRGFGVRVSGSGRAIEVCLLAPEGEVLSCAETPPEPEADAPGEGAGADADADNAGEAGDESSEPPEPLDDDDYAAMTAAAFHEQAFAMPVGLSNIDLGSLDGTATIADEAARERMQGLLDKVRAEAED